MINVMNTYLKRSYIFVKIPRPDVTKAKKHLNRTHVFVNSITVLKSYVSLFEMKKSDHDLSVRDHACVVARRRGD